MIQVITATFEDGVLKPDEPLNFLPQSRVRLVVEPLEDPAEQHQRAQAWEAIERLWQHPIIDSEGQRRTREQLHERR